MLSDFQSWLVVSESLHHLVGDVRGTNAVLESCVVRGRIDIEAQAELVNVTKSLELWGVNDLQTLLPKIEAKAINVGL